MATDPSTYGEQLAADPIRLGIADAAMRLGVSADTIRRRIKRGQLSASRDNTGKLWLILPAILPRQRHRCPCSLLPMLLCRWSRARSLQSSTNTSQAYAGSWIMPMLIATGS